MRRSVHGPGCGPAGLNGASPMAVADKVGGGLAEEAELGVAGDEQD